MTLRKIAFVTLAALGCMFAVSGCGRHDDGWGTEPKLKVMTSFPPIYSLAANVAGDKAVVQSLLDTTDVHSYHASPHDSIRLHRANLFLLNGLDLDEEFAKTLKNNADNPDLKIIEIGEDDRLKDKLLAMKKEGGAHAGHHHGANDPHIWLGLPEAILMVEVIRDEMKKADPANAGDYDKNATEYIAKLKGLLEEGRKELKDKKERKFVTFHDSLAYFARAFDLQIFATIQPFAGEDPAAGQLGPLADRCEKEGVRVVVVEPGAMANSAANTLVTELNKKKVKDVVLVEVDMLENAPRSQLTPDYYERKMRKNIEELAKKLK
jgi:zinc transport system substrate-binding protein